MALGRASFVYEAVWGRVFAKAYDVAFVLAEKRGLSAIRRDLIGRAAGRVLELGAGTGRNIEHYPESITELVLSEPDAQMIARLRRRVALSPGKMSVLGMNAEEISVRDASVDTVVSTLVLCSVRDPVRTLAEVARILRPGGTFLFAEHVRSDSVSSARWQDKMSRTWGWCACGCQCNRDTLSTLDGSPLRVEAMWKDRLHWVGPLIRPLVVGVATNIAR